MPAKGAPRRLQASRPAGLFRPAPGGLTGEKMKIAILDGQVLNPGDLDWSPISSIGPTDIYGETRLEQMAERTRDVDVVVHNKIPLRGEWLEAMSPSVKLVALLATGYDNVDIQACARRGIPVCNVIAYGTDDVAQHTMALLLELCRGVAGQSDEVRRGGWSRRNVWCYWLKTPVNLAGLTMGLVGFGAIGRKVGELAHAFGMKVLACCRTPKNPPSYTPFAFASMDQVFAESDVISLHCPLTPETRGLVCAERIAEMKDGAYIVNAARGGLVCDADLARALVEGKVAGFATDVLSTEPPAEDNPLLAAPNAVITPHIAWASVQSRQRIIRMVGENIRRWMAGTPVNVVNKPARQA